MKVKFFLFVFCSLILFGFNTTAFSQKFTADSFQIEYSTAFEELKSLRTANPKLSATELAAAGNALLDKKGLNYDFAFDAPTCQRIREAQAKQKDPKIPLKLKADFKSVEGETTNVILPPINFEIDACGRCFTKIPLLEATEKDFITIIRNRNIKFFTPPNFIADEVYLLDNKSPNQIVRRWKVPFRAQPIGVSSDGKIIYLELPLPELKDLTLLIFEEGVFQLYAKSDAALSEKPVVLKDFKSVEANANVAFVSFGAADNRRVLQYPTACK